MSTWQETMRLADHVLRRYRAGEITREEALRTLEEDQGWDHADSVEHLAGPDYDPGPVPEGGLHDADIFDGEDEHSDAKETKELNP